MNCPPARLTHSSTKTHRGNTRTNRVYVRRDAALAHARRCPISLRRQSGVLKDGANPPKIGRNMLRVSVDRVWTALNHACNTSAILVMLSAASVSAQPGTTPQTDPQPKSAALPTVDAKADEQARAQFEEGRTAYQAGRYRDAWAKFREAYKLSGRPELLYNIGQTADRLGREEDAIKAFELYLKHTPDAANRRDVENRVRALRERVTVAQSHPPQTAAFPSSTSQSAAAIAPATTTSAANAPPEYPPRPINPWPEPEAEILRPGEKRAVKASAKAANKPVSKVDLSKGAR